MQWTLLGPLSGIFGVVLTADITIAARPREWFAPGAKRILFELQD